MSILQPWVDGIPHDEQWTLLCFVRPFPGARSVRGLYQWARRCFLKDDGGRVLNDPYETSKDEALAPAGPWRTVEGHVMPYGLEEMLVEFENNVPALSWEVRRLFAEVSRILAKHHPEKVVRAWWDEHDSRISEACSDTIVGVIP